MQITIDISDKELTAEGKVLLKESLRLKDEELDAALIKICKTAFLEYCKMFTEKGLPTRADEVMQERLLYLLLY